MLYFAALREVTHTAQETWPAAGGSVGDVLGELTRRHPGLLPHLPTLRYAVNEAFAELHTPLAAGDVLALIPPVSGG